MQVDSHSMKARGFKQQGAYQAHCRQTLSSPPSANSLSWGWSESFLYAATLGCSQAGKKKQHKKRFSSSHTCGKANALCLTWETGNYKCYVQLQERMVKALCSLTLSSLLHLTSARLGFHQSLHLQRHNCQTTALQCHEGRKPTPPYMHALLTYCAEQCKLLSVPICRNINLKHSRTCGAPTYWGVQVNQGIQVRCFFICSCRYPEK